MLPLNHGKPKRSFDDLMAVMNPLLDEAEALPRRDPHPQQDALPPTA